ncbi:MAG TPA: MFS transporter [Ramlibacter sp.]|uniref:MFS transporter n=1 Tax=Ramlibacter sp. TaxID=1917967 RepID=UPI002D7F6DC9|nr:MFS transporter [Ramlibacter sp.]HET8747818.1 MFS transporter [Ramlibacter sp.]
MSLLPGRQVVAIFLAFAFTYFFAALLRAVTATLSPTLTQEFHLHARDLGLLAGGYFLGFASLQLPLGTWLDRHGPKKVLLWFMVLAVLGCAAFALAESFHTLLAARFLCGAGLGACLMAPLTGYRRWFSPATQLRTNSWMLMTGSLGMLASTLPVQWLLPLAGWRPLFWGLALLLGVSMVVLALVVPGWQSAAPAGGARASYREVWRSAYFWQMAPLGFVVYGGLIAVRTLWAGPWMIRVAGYDPVASAGGLFTINLSMLAAFWSWGWITPWLQRRGVHVDRLIAWGVPLHFAATAALIVAGPAAGAGLLAVYCVSATFVSLAQPAVGMHFPAAVAGRALSAFNLLIFLGVFVIQWGIGLLVDGFGALGVGEVSAFRFAFAIFLACCMLSYAWFLWGHSHNRRQSP